MNELDQTMTVKEVAEILNVSERTIQRYVKRIFPEIVKNGESCHLSEYHITKIKMEMNKNYSLDNAVEVQTNLDKKIVIAKAWQYLQEEIETLQNQNELLVSELNDKKSQVKRLVHDNKTYTTTEIAKELNLKSANDLNKILQNKDIQYKINNTWVLTAKYSDCGYESIKQEELDNGKIIYNRHWTGKGRDFILELLGGQND